MKKLLRFLRASLVLTCWSSLFILCSNLLINLIWRFNFMSAKSWEVLASFWNQGGVLKTTSDILLITTLILLPVFWLIGFIFALKLKYIPLLLRPISFVFSLFHRHDDEEPERIVLKNIKSSQQIVEDIKTEIESIKPKESRFAGNFRSEITKKLTEEIKNNRIK